MRPSCEDRVESKQAQQKSDHDRHAHQRELEPGQYVMVRDFQPGPDWVPRVVEEKLGSFSYLVKVGDEQDWR